MNITKANRVADVIKARGIEAEVTVKNDNGVETAGIAMGNKSTRPVIYPDFETNDIEKIADKVIEIYEENKDKEDFSDIMDHFSEFDFVKKDIVPVLVKEVADDVVTRNFLDLKVMYRYILPNKPASIAIRNNHIDIWGITENDLFNLAKDNVKDSFIDRDIADIIQAPERGLMRVIQTKGYGDSLSDILKGGNYGASALLFPELFERYGDKTYILPSSIHEIIVLTTNTDETWGLCKMIQEVNASELLPEQVLSDHPYIYENGVIKEVV